MQKFSLLGSTGSIGTQTLDIVAEHPDKFAVTALAAGGNLELLAEQVGARRETVGPPGVGGGIPLPQLGTEAVARGAGQPAPPCGCCSSAPTTAPPPTRPCPQIRKFQPALVSVRDGSKVDQLKELIKDAPRQPEILAGEEGICAVAAHSEAEACVTGIVGCAGLKPTVAAIESGKDICLANKETLIAGGPFVLPLAQKHGVHILPADSEHSAIFQCLQVGGWCTVGCTRREPAWAAGGRCCLNWLCEDPLGALRARHTQHGGVRQGGCSLDGRHACAMQRRRRSATACLPCCPAFCRACPRAACGASS